MKYSAPDMTSTTGLCFIEPGDAIRTIIGSVGLDARYELLEAAAKAWANEVPENELEDHYAKAVLGLDADGLAVLAEWHTSLGMPQPVANAEFLIGVFNSLDINRRQALQEAAGLRSMDAVDAGVAEDDALELVLGMLSAQGKMELASEAVQLYMWDRSGSEN